MYGEVADTIDTSRNITHSMLNLNGGSMAASLGFNFGVMFTMFGMTFILFFSKNGSDGLQRYSKRRERWGTIFGLLFLVFGVIACGVIVQEAGNSANVIDKLANLQQQRTFSSIDLQEQALIEYSRSEITLNMFMIMSPMLFLFGILLLMMFARRGPIKPAV